MFLYFHTVNPVKNKIQDYLNCNAGSLLQKENTHFFAALFFYLKMVMYVV